MAYTKASLIEFVRGELLTRAHRGLGVLSSRSATLDLERARELGRELLALKLVASFVDLEGIAVLAAGLGTLLARFQDGEGPRAGVLESLSIRVLRRISELAQGITTDERNRRKTGVPRSTVRTLESEIARALRKSEVELDARPLPIGSRGIPADSLRERMKGIAVDDRYVNFAVIDLLQAGERLTDFLPLLSMLSDRGMLLRCGVFAPIAPRRAGSEDVRGLETVYYVVYRTASASDGIGALARLPLYKVAELSGPGDAPGEIADDARELPLITVAHVDAALTGSVVGRSELTVEGGAPPGSRALIPAPRGAPAAPSTQAVQAVARRRSSSIGFKLISIISLLILASLSTMIFLASLFFRSDATVRIEENNHTISSVTAISVGDQFQSIVQAAQLFLNVQARLPTGGSERSDLEMLFFNENPDLIYVAVAGAGEFFNDTYLSGRALSRGTIEQVLRAHAPSITDAAAGASSVQNLTHELATPAMGIFLPYLDGTRATTLVIISSLNRLLQSVQSQGITQTFIVNGDGKLIAHPDLALLSGNIDYSALPIVRKMLTSTIDNGETQYADLSGTSFLGSFKKVPFAGVGVVSTAPVSRAFAAVAQIQRRNIYLMIIVLSIATLIVYFFSKTITIPIRRLVEAARQIERGRFLLDLKATTRDEVGRLTETFVEMGRGLSERERIKDAFGKFVNKSVAEQVLKEEVTLGGERKEATIFFSDIRSFTAISEKLQPEEVVEFLNEYMTRMVECVNETGGVVDKFIGDAIMAVWGVPVSHGNDAEAAITSALLMRESLQEFNRGRGSSSRPVIRIGCGINSGPVVAGQIGSTERMEYTVIGDPVNLASRIEALNKPFGTDILITEDTYSRVTELFAVEPQLRIKVKGKVEPQQVYAVLGRLDDPHRPRTLRELQRLIGVDPAKLHKKKEGEEEVKYEILDE